MRTALTKLRMTGSQGIVVAGTVAQQVRVVSNSLRDFVQGIHVGVSQASVRKGATPVMAGRVEIVGNFVHISLMPKSRVERHGIFAGNAIASSSRTTGSKVKNVGSELLTEGVRVYGFLGAMAFVTRNHLNGFRTGIRVSPFRIPGATRFLWRVTDNVAVGASTTVANPLNSPDLAISGNIP